MLVLANSDVYIVQWLNLQDVISQLRIMGTVQNLLIIAMPLYLLRNINPMFGFKRRKHGMGGGWQIGQVTGIVLDGWTMGMGVSG
jgi:hypothetical protein